jgi:UDP-glucose 4-epimerase
MKVMVVGGAGFIGSHLVDALVEADHQVAVVDNLFLGKRENVHPEAEFYLCDAADPLELKIVMGQAKPEFVYNLAVMPLPHSLVYPLENVITNVKITTNLLELQSDFWFYRMVHFSSSEVYGSALYTPMREDHPLEASTPYAASKAACDLICLSYYRTFGNRVSILRPFNNYGSRQNDQSYAGLIPLTINRILKGESVVIHGDGKQTRDYIYVRDTATAAMMFFGREDLDGEVINIASGKDISVNDMVGAIDGLMGKYIREMIDYQPERPGDVKRHIACTLKAKDLLGFVAGTTLEYGLGKTIEFYEQKNIFPFPKE